MLPSPSDIQYFVEVAETLNISRAAERLGISQPSLTLAIQRIENALGTTILTRTKRGVTLSQSGKQLLAHSRHLLQSWDRIRTQAVASVHEIQGSYTIGCHPSVALYSLSGFLPDILEKNPKLEIRLKHDLSRKITEGVISSEIDLGIAVNPVRHPDLVLHRLCEDEVTLWQRLPIGRETQDIRSGNAVLLCDPDLIQSQAVILQMKKSGIRFKRIVPSSSLEVIAELTSQGCGIGILPSRVAKMARQKLSRIPKAPIFQDEICLLFRIENRNLKTIQALHALIRGTFEEQQPG